MRKKKIEKKYLMSLLLREFANFLPSDDSEKANLIVNFHPRTACASNNYLEMSAFSETFIPFEIYWYIASNHITAKLHNVCADGPKQVAFSQSNNIDLLCSSEVQDGAKPN